MLPIHATRGKLTVINEVAEFWGIQESLWRRSHM